MSQCKGVSSKRNVSKFHILTALFFYETLCYTDSHYLNLVIGLVDAFPIESDIFLFNLHASCSRQLACAAMYNYSYFPSVRVWITVENNVIASRAC